MLNYTREIDINKVLQVAESLEDILFRCFGPDGGQVLFIKSTGDLLITKDGRQILECLLLDHPIARMIVSSASSHSNVTGDGVKSFVLLLCGVLRGLRAVTDNTGGFLLSKKTLGHNRYQKRGHALKRISNLLMTFQSEVLDCLIRKYLCPHFVSVFSSCTERSICRTMLQLTLDTFFCGRIGYNNQVFLSRLACEFFYKCLPSSGDALEVVSLLNVFFHELHTDVSGVPVSNSRILPGIVLHREFSVYCPAEGELRALIVTQQIHDSLSTTDTDFQVSSDTHLQLSQDYLVQRTENIIKQLQKNRIKVILSAVRQPEIVNYFARQSGISIVDCLPPEELNLVCRITGVSPVFLPLSENVGQSADTFLAMSCQPVVIGSRKYVHLILNSSLGFQPHCVVLCGPVKGLTEQFISAFHSAFKMLQQLFHPVDTSLEQAGEGQGQCASKENTPSTEQHISFNNCQRDTIFDFALERINNIEEKSKSGRNHFLSKEPKKPDSERPGDTSYIISSPEVSLANGGLLVTGGGTFEMLLHYYLHDFAQKCQDRDLSVICTIVGNAVLCIPQYINSATKGSSRLPLLYSQVTSDYLKKGLKKGTAQNGLESVACKHQLLVSVLHCISKLVTIDFIIGIKRPPRDAKYGESDDDL
ncbi:Bardet-Biedl syndrome 10 protein [Spea bombifrons]|uniref:Bardet-Biedl syndrome 10 protein n=1 Tax=Spea bombifrons TaxID=233779 RepID=UPI002349FF3C|nr:Bardet-Biedl syndrome 10 protein [Spea bombifrons]